MLRRAPSARNRLAAVRRPRPGAGEVPRRLARRRVAHLRLLRAPSSTPRRTWCCAFKPQIAYFAAHRAEDQLERLIAHIHRVAPGVPVILDAKRGDIGATAEQYAREAFERYQADAVTLSPFMGFDSIEPYLRYAGKGADPAVPHLQPRRQRPAGAAPGRRGELLYEHIARLAAGPWNRGGQLGLVVGATFPAEIARVRELAPTLPLLIPGIGAQGGDAEATVRAGWRAASGADHRQLLARHPLCLGRRRLRRSRAPRGAGHARSS